MKPPRVVGSTWLHIYDGKLWPVVLCDDKMPPKDFIETKRNLIHIPNILPAILLGKHIFIWVTDHGLEEFDPHKDYFGGLTRFENEDPVKSDSKDDREAKIRRNAFRRDAVQFQRPEFWKNYIDSEAEVKRLEKGMRGNRKRKRPSNDDDEAEVLSIRSTPSKTNHSSQRRGSTNGRHRLGSGPLLTPGPTPVKSIEKADSGVSVIDLDAQEINGDSDDDGLFVGPSKIKSDPFVSNSDDEDPVRQGDQQTELEKIRESNLLRIRNNPPTYDACTIFVGKEFTPFSASVLAVRRCKFLESAKRFDNDLRSHINLYEESDIQREDFAPIGEYLQRKDFTPRLIDSDTRPRIEKVILPEEKDDAAKRIAMTYRTASKIQFADVQLLCVDKLKVLYPLSPQNLLIVVMIINKSEAWGCDAEVEVREWLVDHLVQHFWSLVEFEHKNLMKVMMDNETLSQSVFQKLADNPKAGRQDMDLG